MKIHFFNHFPRKQTGSKPTKFHSKKSSSVREGKRAQIENKSVSLSRDKGKHKQIQDYIPCKQSQFLASFLTTSRIGLMSTAPSV